MKRTTRTNNTENVLFPTNMAEDSATRAQDISWDPPFPDAVDVMLATLTRLTDKRNMYRRKQGNLTNSGGGGDNSGNNAGGGYDSSSDGGTDGSRSGSSRVVMPAAAAAAGEENLFPAHPTLRIDMVKKKKEFLKYYNFVIVNGSQILL